MNDINDIIPKSSGSVSFFYPSWLPQSPPLPGAVPLRIKMEPNMAVTLKSALAALAALLASNTIILCSGWAPLTQESWEVHPDAAEVFHDCCMNHPMAYIYILYLFICPRWSFCYRMRYLKAGTEWFLATILCKKIDLGWSHIVRVPHPGPMFYIGFGVLLLQSRPFCTGSEEG